ncbi:MAG: dihydrolipoyl dehydrogenase [Sphingomonadales bacterium]|nr:dihydrolipoyl dehydrogenase [Sphingomonadales bacterium]
MSEDSFDLVVIGSGPGGYVAAIRAAQNGLNVACVEKGSTLGGTCLNVGCMPSKALLHASEVYDSAKNHMAELGVDATGVKLNLKQMMAQKDKTVSDLTGGIAYLFKKNKVTHFEGFGSLKDKNTVEIKPTKGKAKTIKADNIIIATGSEVSTLPGIKIDEKIVVSSTGALSLPKVPKHLLVIGGGVIGLELGSVWKRLGAKVTVVEYLDRLIPGMDLEVAKNFARILKKQGFDIKTSSKVVDVKTTKTGAKVKVEPAKGGKAETIAADVVLMAVGRKPYTEGLGLEKLGVEMDKIGRIKVSGDFSSSVSNIYAIGDVIEGPMLAHKAEDEGVACADNIAGLAGHVNHDVIPGVIYTMPEVSAVGKTEEDLKEAGIAYNSGKFPFTANSRAKANHQTDGFVKVLTDKETDKVLGVHIIGSDAGNMIAEAALALEFGASAEDIALTCHAHPTQTEAVKEAAMAAFGKPIHM